jgi:hypothetical protein
MTKWSKRGGAADGGHVSICVAGIVIARVPVLHHVDDSKIMNHGSNHNTKVKQLVTSKPDIELARPKALGYSKAVYQHSNNIRAAHAQQIS